MTPQSSASVSPTLPRVGMLATVRNRRGIISAVDPFDGGTEGRLHLVTVEYTDAEYPPEDQLLWEREPYAALLEPTALPQVSQHGPMAHEEFDALVRATRWTAIAPFVDPDGEGGPLTRFPIAAPFHGAIQVDDFQLVPLLKALRMPRIALLLADDVGLGKTIEAGLILSELLIRRRVRRVLIICPASLRSQWRQEMQDKFALSFDEVDRDSTQNLRKRLGMDANPWRTFPTDLFDRGKMTQHFFQLGRILLGRDRARDLRDRPDWFETLTVPGPLSQLRSCRLGGCQEMLPHVTEPAFRSCL